MKKVKHEKSATRKKCTLELAKHEKGVQHGKECNMKKVKHEKNATRKKYTLEIAKHEENTRKKPSIIRV